MRASTAAGRARPRTASMAWTSDRRIGLLVDRGQDPFVDLGPRRARAGWRGEPRGPRRGADPLGQNALPIVTWMWYGPSPGRAVELVAPVDAHRSHRGLVAQAEPGRVEDLLEVDVGDHGVDRPRIGEGREGQGPAEVVAQLEPAEEQGVSSRGHELAAASELERACVVGLEPSRAVVAPGEEALGQGQLNRLALAEGPGEAETPGKGQGEIRTDPAVGRGLQEPLHEAGAPEERKRRLDVRAQKECPRRGSRESSRRSSTREREGPERV